MIKNKKVIFFQKSIIASELLNMKNLIMKVLMQNKNIYMQIF